MMRLLAILLAVVLLAALIRWERSLPLDTQRTLASTDDVIFLQAFSNGPGLEPYPYLTAQSGLDGLIVLGPVLLRSSRAPDGLATAAIAPDRTLHRFEVIPVARGADQVRTLAELARSMPAGSVLALARKGKVAGGAVQRAVLDSLCAALDAHARPDASDTCSWVLLTTRTESGWRALVESYADTIGVMASIALTVESPSDRIRVPERTGVAAARRD